MLRNGSNRRVYLLATVAGRHSNEFRATVLWSRVTDVRSELLRRHVAPCSQLSSVRWHLAHSATTPSGNVVVVSSDSYLLSFAVLPKSPSINTSGNLHVSAELPNLRTSASSSQQCNDHKTLHPLLWLCCMVTAQDRLTLALRKTHENRSAKLQDFC
jgi:hypothetical protein